MADLGIGEQHDCITHSHRPLTCSASWEMDSTMWNLVCIRMVIEQTISVIQL